MKKAAKLTSKSDEAAAQVRCPVQMNFAHSVEPVLPLEISITRVAATNEAEKKERIEGVNTEEKRGDARTVGRKHVIPYGLHRAHGYVLARLASHPIKGTGFSDEDLQLLFGALSDMFEHDRSAARGAMATRKLVVFRHRVGVRAWAALCHCEASCYVPRVMVRKSGPLRSPSMPVPSR